jgi:hypothetical protein
MAHPLTEAVVLPIAPIAVAGLAACLVIAVASFGSATPAEGGDLDRVWSGPLTSPEVSGRAVTIILLGLALAAGRLGEPAAPRNLAPTLLVAAGIPVLALSSVVLGPLWRRIDPFDGLARLCRAPDGAVPAGSADEGTREAAVWPAAFAALLGVAYLTVYPAGLRPRALGLTASVYVLVTLGGCLAVGRVAWLRRFEPIGLLLTWFGGIRRGRLVAWSPPAGAGAVLGVVAGGLIFGLVRGTSLYVSAAFAVGPRQADVGGVILFAALGAGAVVAAERRRRDGTAVAAAVPVVAGIVLAHSLADGRALFALQRLPALLIDPLNQGWTLGEIGQTALRPLPFGAGTLAMLQLGVLVATGVIAARVVRRRTSATSRVAGPVSAVLMLVMAGVLGITTA